MSKGRGGTNLKFNVKSRRRSTVVLEASSSAEIASYDYEAALSQPELEESQNRNDNEVKTSPLKDHPLENKETTPRDLGKESAPKTVCFSPDNQVPGKLTAAAELATGNSHGQWKITNQECAACKIIVDESGDENEEVDINASVAGSKELLKYSTPGSEVKKRGKVSSARSEKTEEKSPITKGSEKDLAKKKGITSSLVSNKKTSKIPRAMKTTYAASKVYPNARLPSRRNSRTSLGSRSFFSTRRKPTEASLRKEQCADAKTDQQPCEKSPRTQVGNAGDHPSAPSATSLLRNLRMNNVCRSCNDQRETVNLELSIHDVQDSWSDSKSSPEIRSPNRWSRTPKMGQYVDSTSEEVDLSSEYSSDRMRPERKRCFAVKASSRSPISKSGCTRNPPGLKPRRRARFSFLHTLFDIVFWPFLFLRTNR